ncbi:hypothetical protein IPA_02855 [Ignicoccus pacificus DSM 13166]|uniref:dolichyl-phosphooligosaccharide-protein glycotransferase n=1 Tax=Ignicoccus pacificus DSM 13166 TaxID=940294 RepID=A0A977PLE1_9CREN|nr:hypothetical protein IPA_02855 [Ignicoccus pacificus DSM 13166]
MKRRGFSAYLSRAEELISEPKVAIPILVAVVLIAFYIRLSPYFMYSHYGIWLQYDDSMFEYWLSKVLYQHGITYWYQLTPQNTRHLWWWPEGRDITRTEFPGLGFTGAMLYPIAKLFGLRMVDWVGIIPAFYGMLTVIVTAILGWVIGGPILSILMAIAVAFQYAFLQRSIASFVEKMSPTTFFSTIYLITFALTIKKYVKSKEPEKYALLMGFIGGIALAMSSAFWGGFLAFIGVVIIGIALFPFIKGDAEISKVMVMFAIGTVIGYLASSWWITTVWKRKLGIATTLLLSALVVESGVQYFVLKRFKDGVKIWGYINIAIIAILLLLAHTTHILHQILSPRYLFMIMPWLRHAASPLERSVAEHQGILQVINPNSFPSVFGVGVLAPLSLLIALMYLLKKEKQEVLLMTMPLIAMALFATYLVLADTSVYLTTLLGFMLAVGGALTVYWLLEDFPRLNAFEKLFAGIVLLIALVLYVSGSIAGINFAVHYPPPSYLSAGTALYTPLYPDTMHFIKNHCKFVLAWWDYGYMIGTVANATTVVDPATLSMWKISKVALALTGTEEDLVKVAKLFKLPANETCVFAYEVFPYVPNTKTILGIPQVGDFAKSVWMLRIRGLNDSQIYGHYIMYLVSGELANGQVASVLVPSPQSIRVVGNAIEVRTLNGRLLLFARILQIVPVVNINKALLYKMIYYGVVSSGYHFQEPGLPVPKHVEFKHLKLLKAFIEKLYIPNTNKAIPNIRAVSVVYLYTG